MESVKSVRYLGFFFNMISYLLTFANHVLNHIFVLKEIISSHIVSHFIFKSSEMDKSCED